MSRAHVEAVVKAQTRMLVRGGPFAGLRLLDQACWGDGDLTPKLLGVYEQELHPAIARFSAGGYGAVVVVGCAEGYYAVGMARLMPGVPVYAFDSDPAALAILAGTAAANGVTERVRAAGACGPETLVALSDAHGRLLVICDCEGFEAQLFSGGQVRAALRRSDVIVECHDFAAPGCTERLAGFFLHGHALEILYCAGRNPNVFPFLAHLNDQDRWAAVCEYRPCLMHWLIAEARFPQG